jgi:hypothetical protein
MMKNVENTADESRFLNALNGEKTVDFNIMFKKFQNDEDEEDE